MPKNLEIKCRVKDVPEMKRLVKSAGPYRRSVEKQKDIYYNVKKGRLKLRIINNKSGSLIYYSRGEKTSRRVSDYTISKTGDHKELDRIMRSLFGVKIVVSKKREIYIHKNIRIHLDNVSSLGTFLEIEIIIDKLSEAGKMMKDLLIKLKLDDNEFIRNGYSDLLISK